MKNENRHRVFLLVDPVPATSSSVTTADPRWAKYNSDFTEHKEVDLSTIPMGWNFEMPEPRPSLEPGFSKIEFASEHDGTDHYGDRIISRDGSRVLLMTSEHMSKKTYGLILCELQTGRKGPHVLLPDLGFRPLAYDSEQNLLAAIGNVADGGPQVLRIWKVTAKGFEIVSEWKISSADSARFVTDRHLLTIHRDRLTLWNFVDMKAMRTVVFKSWNRPSFDSSGEYCVNAEGDSIFLFRTADLEPVGRITRPDERWPALAIDDDGRQVVMISSQIARVFDAPSNKQIREFSLPSMSSIKSMRFVDQRRVMVFDGRKDMLIDIDAMTYVWYYKLTSWAKLPTPIGSNKAFTNVRLGRGKQALIAFDYPHQAAIEASEEIDPEENAALKPGEAVSIQLGSGFDSDIAEAIRQKLEDWGVRVMPGSSKVMRAVVKGSARTEKYRDGISPFAGTRNLKVTGRVYGLELFDNETWIWGLRSISGGQAPRILSLEPGESAQGALNKMNRGDPGKLFSDFVLPKYIARLPETFYRGMSDITPEGLVDKPPPKIGSIRR